jgi:alkanesulfonate monooxygenase SsuD/methylene tetrahydromethanopterin reductase-like flavin-dependent oxidoreductase (luciferase family)
LAENPALGVTFRPSSPPEDLRAAVQAADRAGIAELWLWEDCFAEGGLTAAAAALSCSNRIKVGVGLLPVPLRNPALAAMEIATLARLWPGRFMPGLGHGVQDWMTQIGAGVPSPMTLLREYTKAVRDLLHGSTVTADGRYVQLDQVKLDWPPEQVPPLLVGARGPRTLRLAGELADGVILDSVGAAEEVRAARELLAEGRAAAGRDGATQVTVFTELEVAGGPLKERMAERAAMLGQAGADSVVFHASGDQPDPGPHIEALAPEHPHTGAAHPVGYCPVTPDGGGPRVSWRRRVS